MWHGGLDFCGVGALHGLYLIVCYGWNALVDGYKNCPRFGMLMKPFAYVITFMYCCFHGFVSCR
ncbi:MAG: hypothetical protein R3E67_08370 [Pseudomonadales bacterium]